MSGVPITLFERRQPAGGVSFDGLLRGEAQIGGRTSFTLADYVAEIERGGFPGFRHLGERAVAQQLDSYLQRVVDHDLVESGLVVRRSAIVRAWLRAYAAATATTASWEKIRAAATTSGTGPPARSSTLPYAELLTSLRLLDPIDAWLPTGNHLRATNSAPKHHLADPALAARLVRRSAVQLLHGEGPAPVVPRDGPFLGALFESLAALSIRTFAQRCGATTAHLRTQGGRHEVDFIVERADGGVLAIEAKLAGSVGDADVRHLLWLRELLGDDCVDTVVVNTGPEAYRRRDGVAVVPLALLGP